MKNIALARQRGKTRAGLIFAIATKGALLDILLETCQERLLFGGFVRNTLTVGDGFARVPRNLYET